MAKKIKLTRPELKRQRETLKRFERYLPMLKLKQQQLQSTVQELSQKLRQAQTAIDTARATFEKYSVVLRDRAGLNVRALAKPAKVLTSSNNIAGVSIPIYEGAEFERPNYSLFATPAWVDRALADLREISRLEAELEVLRRQYDLLQRELTKMVQRVNLFEKVKIPEAKEIIRVIRIKLGDEMTAGVGRAKIAKAKISETQETESHAASAEPERPEDRQA